MTRLGICDKCGHEVHQDREGRWVSGFLSAQSADCPEGGHHVVEGSEHE